MKNCLNWWGQKMYKCDFCKQQVGANLPQLSIITKKRKLQEKGWEIREKKNACYKCYEKKKTSKGAKE